MNLDHFKRKNQTLPPKGTKLRTIMLMMLRPEGVMLREVLNQGLCSGKGAFTSNIRNITDFKGWDVEVFYHTRKPAGHSGRQYWASYRIVGKNLDNGGYRAINAPIKEREMA